MTPRLLLSIVLLFVTIHFASAQITVTVTGTTSVTVGETKLYKAIWKDGSNLTLPPSGTHQWIVTGGTVTSNNSNQANVNWTSPGNHSVKFQHTSGYEYELPVLVNGVAPPVPNTTFTIVQNCGSTTITRNSNPPSGNVEWYWQTTSNGQSMVLGNNATLVWNSATPSPVSIYLQARNTAAPNNWSTGSQAAGNVTVISSVPSPASSTGSHVVSNNAAPVTLNVSTVSGATKYKWFSAQTGGTALAETSGTSYSPIISQATDYYVSAVIGNCESATRTQVTGYLHPVPFIHASGNLVLRAGQVVTLQVQYAYDTYQWKRDGVNISGATSSSYQAGLAGTYTVSVTKGNSASVLSSNSVILTLGIAGQHMNYVMSNTALRPGILTEDDINIATVNNKTQATQYFDDLGRPVQSVITQGSPDELDIVQPIAYDQFGRETVKYLPYVSGNDGYYKTNFIDKNSANYTNDTLSPQYNFYQQGGDIATTSQPYAETRLETSPLSRVIKQGAAGSSWQPDGTNTYASTDHTIKSDYTYNISGEVMIWQYEYPVDAHELGLVNPTGTYLSGQLFKNRIKDEQQHEIVEYTDKNGKTILKKVETEAGYAETYYIYNDLGQLVCVLPPEAVAGILKSPSDYNGKPNIDKENFLKIWAFRYAYDGKERMISKQVPGAAVVYMIYDKLDRLTLTQDGNQRAAHKWSYTQYDGLNRPVITGIYAHGTAKPYQSMADLIVANAFSESFTGASTHDGYSNNTFASSDFSGVFYPLTVTYYDNYKFITLWNDAYLYKSDGLTKTIVKQNNEVYTQPATGSENHWVSGRVTGAKVRTLTEDNTGGWLRTATYYDNEYHVVQTVSDNIIGTIDRTSNLVDFTGKVLATCTSTSMSGIKWIDDQYVTLTPRSVKSNISGMGASVKSEQFLPANTNGWIEFTVKQNTTTQYIEFLGGGESFGIYAATNVRFLYEGGNRIEPQDAYLLVGDVMRLERVNGAINYYQNGDLRYTASLASSAALQINIWLDGFGSFDEIRTSFANLPLTINRTFEYDHAGRLLKAGHRIDAGPDITLVKNEYNQLGQLIDKKLHSTEGDGSDARQSIDYRYNIRGWLTSINNAALSQDPLNIDANNNKDLFGMNLAYEQSLSGVTTPGTEQYNGNISSLNWSNNLGLGNVKERAYSFSYDPMNRLKGAFHNERISNVWNTTTAFKEANLEYDLNGNIGKLERTGVAGSDDDRLMYTYEGNKLMTVSDAGSFERGFIDGNTSGNDYTYDVNGNMIADANKGISLITYNHLNLPQRVNKTSGDYILYTYDATGRKLSQQVYNGSNELQKKSDYVGDLFFENDKLQFINHEEGRATIKDGEQPEYQYHLKDHLGNVRLTFTTKDEIETSIATLEDDEADTEQGQFLNYDEAITVNEPMFDYTHRRSGESHTTTKSTRLLGGNTNAVYGLAKSVSVMPGDVINMEVYAKYVDTNQTNWNAALQSVMAAVANPGSPSAAIDNGAPGSLGGQNLFFAPIDHSNDGTSGPKAYLNYIVYGRDITGPPLDMGFIPVPEAAMETGTNIDHVQLATSITIKEAGYVYIYLSNENPTPVEVYFDDFKVEHVKSPVIQMDDYYPFGLSFNSYRRENSIINRYLYNGIELNRDLGMELYMARYRMRDPALGRWLQIDPLNEGFKHLTPYVANKNNPIKNSDPLGNCDWCKEMANKVISYVVNKTVETVKKAIINTAQNVKEEAKKVNPYVKGEIKIHVGPRVAAEVKGVGVDFGKSAEKSATLQYDKSGFGESGGYGSETSNQGKTTSIAKVGIPTEVGAFEGSIKSETVTKGNQFNIRPAAGEIISESTEVAATYAPIPGIGATIGTTTTTNADGSSSTAYKAEIGHGATGIIGVGLEYNISAGFEYKKNN